MKLNKHLSAGQITPRAWSILESIFEGLFIFLHLTPRKVDVEEKMKTKKIIKQAKQHQLPVMGSSICVEIGEAQGHLKHS